MSQIKTISKSTQIDADAKTIWKLLTDPAHYADWAGVFSPGIFVEATWEVGSQVIFSDDSKFGLFGHVTTNKYLHFLEIQYDGSIIDGNLTFDSEEAKSIKEAKHSYKLTEEYEFTTLEIRSDTTAELYDELTKKWDSALENIKELAEN